MTSQQQWLFRNCELGGFNYFQSPPRSVNFVFVGTVGSPPSSPSPQCTNSSTNPASPTPQQLVVDETPVAAEKPYITIEPKSGKYSLVTPPVKRGTRGLQWRGEAGRVDSFESVFVATNASDVALINAKLAAGLHVVLSPGVYRVKEAIRLGTVQWCSAVQCSAVQCSAVPVCADS